MRAGQCIGHLRPMCTSVNPSLFPFFNKNTGDEWCRARNALESSLSPGPCHLAFAFAFQSNTSYLYIREVLVFMGPDDADARLRSLLILTDMENRLTIHSTLMDLRQCRAHGKMLHKHSSGNRASKDSLPVAQIINDTFSRPTHGRMAASRVVASALQKSPRLMTRRATVGMMDGLNGMTTPFILYGAASPRCEGATKRR